MGCPVVGFAVAPFPFGRLHGNEKAIHGPASEANPIPPTFKHNLATPCAAHYIQPRTARRRFPQCRCATKLSKVARSKATAPASGSWTTSRHKVARSNFPCYKVVSLAQASRNPFLRCVCAITSTLQNCRF